MKVFLVSCFLILTLLSLGWGKHYLVETHDADDVNDNDIEYSGLDLENMDAETLIHRALKGEELERHKNLSKKDKKKAIAELNKFLKIVKIKSEGKDYAVGAVAAAVIGGIAGAIAGGIYGASVGVALFFG